MTFNENLNQLIRVKKSFLCVGIDPDLGKMPAFLPQDADGIYQFSKAIIEATHHLAVAFKPNLAFFECAGSAGLQVLERLSSEKPDDVLWLLDGKRGDIGNTAEKYAAAMFGPLAADAVTLNPYMGFDAVEPFISDSRHGAFVLGLTSNKSAVDFQHLQTGSGTLFEQVAKKVRRWNTNNNCGLVVGATESKGLKKIRSLVPDLPFLVPGIGAQGGALEPVLKFGRDESGAGLLVNVGRDILYASSSEDFAVAATAKAEKYTQLMNDYI